MPLFPLSDNKRILLRPVLFILTALEGLFVFYRLVQVPRSPHGGLAAGISILLMVLAALLTLALLAGSYFTWHLPHKTLFDLSDAQHNRRLEALSLLALAAIPLTITTSTSLHSLYLGTENIPSSVWHISIWTPSSCGQVWLLCSSGCGSSSRNLKN